MEGGGFCLHFACITVPRGNFYCSQGEFLLFPGGIFSLSRGNFYGRGDSFFSGSSGTSDSSNSSDSSGSSNSRMIRIYGANRNSGGGGKEKWKMWAECGKSVGRV